MLLRSTHFTTPRAKKPRKKLIPEAVRPVYADVVVKAVELRRQGKTHAEVCEELNRLGYRSLMDKPWQHPQQIIKLLRSFGGEQLVATGDNQKPNACITTAGE